MLITAGGERAGTISGGCLEAEVSRRAWWLTRNGPAVEIYESTLDEEGGPKDGPSYGLGCGGTLSLLLEREPHAVLQALEHASIHGRPAVILHRLRSSSGSLGSTALLDKSARRTLEEPFKTAVAQAWTGHNGWLYEGAPASSMVAVPRPRENALPAAWVEFLKPPPRLTIFGAGEDVQPLARFTSDIGWRVAVADGRRHLLRPERFPSGTQMVPLEYPACELDLSCGMESVDPQLFPPVPTGIAAGEFAVIMTHSYEQDRNLLHALLPAGLRYLGILGPRHRTLRLLEAVAPSLGWALEQCWAGLHSPVGLDLGTRDPATIALSIAAELQATAASRLISVTRLEADGA